MQRDWNAQITTSLRLTLALLPSSDISFWKQRQNMTGLSVRSLFLSLVCQVIIFLYLLDQVGPVACVCVCVCVYVRVCMRACVCVRAEDTPFTHVSSSVDLRLPSLAGVLRDLVRSLLVHSPQPLPSPPDDSFGSLCGYMSADSPVDAAGHKLHDPSKLRRRAAHRSVEDPPCNCLDRTSHAGCLCPHRLFNN